MTAARQLNPSLTIVARSRSFIEIEELRAAGADEVIAEDFETSLEILTTVLLHVPGNVIRTQARLLRADGYQMLRAPAPTGMTGPLRGRRRPGAGRRPHRDRSRIPHARRPRRMTATHRSFVPRANHR